MHWKCLCLVTKLPANHITDKMIKCFLLGLLPFQKKKKKVPKAKCYHTEFTTIWYDSKMTWQQDCIVFVGVLSD